MKYIKKDCEFMFTICPGQLGIRSEFHDCGHELKLLACRTAFVVNKPDVHEVMGWGKKKKKLIPIGYGEITSPCSVS